MDVGEQLTYGGMISAASIGIGSAATWLWGRYTAHHTGTVAELGKIIESIKEDNAKLKQDYDKLYDDFQQRDALREVKHADEIRSLRTEIRDNDARCETALHRQGDRLTRALLQNQELRTEVRTLQATVFQLNAGFSPILSATNRAFTFVAVDENGIVVEANPAVLMMFHRNEDEVIGRHIKLLIPPRLHAEFDREAASLVAAGGLSVQGVTVQGFGITREGDEFAVEAYIETHKRDGKLRCCALLSRVWRGTTPGGSGGEVPVYRGEEQGGEEGQG